MENTNMPHDFWSQVWQEGVIRFHQKEYNPQMVSFFKEIDLKDKQVLIPLAGKTRDILFFLEKGAIVTAIEFVESAILEFFTDNKIEYTKIGNIFSSHNLKFVAADFFQFNSLKAFDVLYDRASQVVFKKEERPAYYTHIKTLINSNTICFLGAVEHLGSHEYGPPYKISEIEIVEAYQKMGIILKKFAEIHETASEKMQQNGIEKICSYFLVHRPSK